SRAPRARARHPGRRAHRFPAGASGLRHGRIRRHRGSWLQALRDDAPDRNSDVVGRSFGIDEHAAFRFGRGDRVKTPTQLAMKFLLEALKALLLRASLACAREPLFRIEIQYESEFGRETAERGGRQPVHYLRAEPTGDALIDDRGIGKAV